MGTKRIRRTTITALIVAAATAAPAAGMPIDPLGSPSTSGIPAPPPSSIAESAAEEYSEIRAQAAETMRAAEAEAAAASTAPATVTDGGFDVPSAAIGAAAAGLDRAARGGRARCAARRRGGTGRRAHDARVEPARLNRPGRGVASRAPPGQTRAP